MEERIRLGMGWLPDYPDHRDFTLETPRISRELCKVGLGNGTAKVELPTSVDLREWCSPIENQESIGSCTAQAAAGLVEYFERRAYGKHIDMSRLFIYKTTRNLLGWTGDTGAFIRTAMGAITLFGSPPEKFWPYSVAKFDREPSAFCYAFAQSYQALSYYRLDVPGTKREDLLRWAKAEVASGLPFMFGFSVYESIEQAKRTGKIPYPAPGEKRVGGHAVVAVGYHNCIKITNTTNGKETVGALLIRNSWGKDWGDIGYGWLPYEYVLRWQAVDWWALISNEWIDTGKFGI